MIATDELGTMLEGQMEFEVASQVHHPLIGEELLNRRWQCKCPVTAD